MRIRFSFSSRRTRTIEGHNQHRTAYPKLVKEVIRISDIVLEVIDARFIEDTINPEMEQVVKDEGKKLIYIINKADLVDLDKLENDIEKFKLKSYVVFSCKSFIGRTMLRNRLKIEIKKMKVEHKKAHIGIIGYPNTGKSSLINLLTGRKASGTSAQAGFTRGMQKIRFNKDILILDTPGVFPEKENSTMKSSDLKKEGKIGVRTYDKVKEPDFVVFELMKDNPGLFEEYYNIDAQGDAEILFEQLGRQKNLLKKGNEVDVDRTARIILKDWQEGKIKRKVKVNP